VSQTSDFVDFFVFILRYIILSIEKGILYFRFGTLLCNSRGMLKDSCRYSVFICNGLVCVFLCVSVDHFGFVFFNFVLLGLVVSIPSGEIGGKNVS